ncbi:MAG: EF-hand domain-containing protein [Gammaproteobacteria bacterium]|nr:EF-hand domain-containing protein [Gammaproteobacteria bacterium]
MRIRFIFLVVLLSISFGSWAGGLNKAALFEDVDTDGDKTISKAEANDRDDLKENFAKIDANKDGKLDISEFSAFETAGSTSVPESDQPEPGAAPTR